MYSLIVVDYNGLKKTIEYIEHCRQSLDAICSSHVVIVENGIEENALESLMLHFGEYQVREIARISQKIYFFVREGQELCYCSAGSNLGYAKGNNLGVRIATTIWSDPYYIISNNDLVFEKAMDISIVDRLFKNDPEIGVIGPCVVTPEGVQQSPRQWKRAFSALISDYWVGAAGGLFGSKLRNKLCDRASDTLINANSGKSDWISGCFMFVRADLFHKIGMFDENTFLYAEELILSKRLEAIGCSVYYCKELEVIHKHGQTTKTALDTLKMTEIDFSAKYYFYKTYMQTNCVVLVVSKLSFKVFCALFKIKQHIRRVIAKES